MSNVRMYDLTFKGFMKLFVYFSLSLGLVVGIIALLGSIIGLPVRTTLIFIEAEGFGAGILSLFIGPIVFAILGVLLGLLAYLPFKFLLKVTDGIRIDGKFSE